MHRTYPRFFTSVTFQYMGQIDCWHSQKWVLIDYMLLWCEPYICICRSNKWLDITISIFHTVITEKWTLAHKWEKVVHSDLIWKQIPMEFDLVNGAVTLLRIVLAYENDHSNAGILYARDTLGIYRLYIRITGKHGGIRWGRNKFVTL